jgi:hypothetical protein
MNPAPPLRLPDPLPVAAPPPLPGWKRRRCVGCGEFYQPATAQQLRCRRECGYVRSDPSGRAREKLNPERVREMRRLYQQQRWTLARLAARYGVNEATVSRAVNYVSWRNVS